MRDALDGEHREASRPRCSSRCGRRTGLRSRVRRRRRGCSPRARSPRDAGTCRSCDRHLTISVRLPRSSPANWYSESVSGTGVTAPRMVAGSAPSATAIGKGLPGMRARWSRKSSAPPRCGEPAHDQLVRADHLLAIDAEVLPLLVRAARHRQPPGDQRPASPGQQVCTGSGRGRRRSPSHTISWQRRRGRSFGAMSSTCMNTGRLSPRVRRLFGGSGSLRKASSRPTSRRLSAQCSAAPMPRATRCGVPNRLPSTGMVPPPGARRPAVLEKDGGAAGLEHAVAEFGHLEARVHAGAHALELTGRLQLRDEVAQVAIGHDQITGFAPPSIGTTAAVT